MYGVNRVFVDTKATTSNSRRRALLAARMRGLAPSIPAASDCREGWRQPRAQRCQWSLVNGVFLHFRKLSSIWAHVRIAAPPASPRKALACGRQLAKAASHGRRRHRLKRPCAAITQHSLFTQNTSRTVGQLCLSLAAAAPQSVGKVQDEHGRCAPDAVRGGAAEVHDRP